MGIISWIVIGFIAGALAKFIMPGKDPGGMLVTILIGVAGAFVGGFVGAFFGFGDTGINLVNLILSTGGAVTLLVLYSVIKS